MKKTGSVRVEIIDTNEAETGYLVELELMSGPVRYYVPKSVVTDIREEVDWSKVEKGTWIVYRHTPIARWIIIPFGSYNPVTRILYDDEGQSRELSSNDDIMPLDQWLKEHGDEKDKLDILL